MMSIKLPLSTPGFPDFLSSYMLGTTNGFFESTVGKGLCLLFGLWGCTCYSCGCLSSAASFIRLALRRICSCHLKHLR